MYLCFQHVYSLLLFSSSALPPGTNGSCCVSLGLLFTCFPYCLDYSISTSLGVAVCFPNCIYACSAENWVGRGTHKSWMMRNHTPPSDRECPDRLTLFGLCWDCRRICTKHLTRTNETLGCMWCSEVCNTLSVLNFSLHVLSNSERLPLELKCASLSIMLKVAKNERWTKELTWNNLVD